MMGRFESLFGAPRPGMMPDIYQTFMAAKDIHEKLGAKINIYNEGVGGTGNIHYVMSRMTGVPWLNQGTQ